MKIKILPKQNDNALCSTLPLGIKRKSHLFAPWLWQKWLDCFNRDLQKSALFHLFISSAHPPEQIWAPGRCSRTTLRRAVQQPRNNKVNFKGCCHKTISLIITVLLCNRTAKTTLGAWHLDSIPLQGHAQYLMEEGTMGALICFPYTIGFLPSKVNIVASLDTHCHFPPLRFSH